MQGIFRFLSYNNAVPIALGIVFLGAGGAFAATNPDTIYKEESQVIAPDNTYIVNTDLASYTPTATIDQVTEDEDFYYVAYSFSTIDVTDAVWQDVTKEKTMKVDKRELGETKDLGVYVTEQLRQHIDRELAYLKEVQQIERKQVSRKTVATKYSGIVGGMLTDKTEELPDYQPVVTPPGPEYPGDNRNRNVAAAAGSDSGQESTEPSSQTSSGAGAPTVQILGNNPAYLELGAQYADLGVVITDDVDANLGYTTYVNDEEVQQIQLDTSTTTEYAIAYEVTDTDSNTTRATRRVIVYDPANPPVFEEQTQSQSAPPQETDSSGGGGEEVSQQNADTSDATTSSGSPEDASQEQSAPADDTQSSATEGGSDTTASDTEQSDASLQSQDGQQTSTTGDGGSEIGGASETEDASTTTPAHMTADEGSVEGEGTTDSSSATEQESATTTEEQTAQQGETGSTEQSDEGSNATSTQGSTAEQNTDEESTDGGDTGTTTAPSAS